MKIRYLIPAMLLVITPTYGEQPEVNMENMQQRLQEMEVIMSKAQDAKGKERQKLMRKHMLLMVKQMREMHHMMSHEDTMDANTMSEEDLTQATQQWMRNMEQRMDVMQQMMEQILEQEKMHADTIYKLPVPG